MPTSIPAREWVASLDLGELLTAVAAATSWRGVLRNLGFGERNGRVGRLLRDRCDALGIDHSHFGQRRWRDSELAPAVKNSRNWHDLMTALGYAKDSGSARSTVRAHCLRLGVDISAFERMLPPDIQSDRSEGVSTRHLRSAGPMLVAAAMTLRGWRVAWPLEPAPYDLLVDNGGERLRRVQVKTTTQRTQRGWNCQITRHIYAAGDAGGGHLRQVYDPREIDDIAVVDGDLRVYLIPYSRVAGLSTISLSRYSDTILGLVLIQDAVECNAPAVDEEAS